MKGIQLRQELMLDLLQMKEISTYRQQKNGTRIFQYKVEKRDEREVNYYEDFLIEKGHNMNNIEWMAHDIKEFVDHTIRKL